MKPISLFEQKQIQVNILDVVVEYCEKNRLRYFLGYGTAIGAIRHKGYIPWDDDIDIIMPRPDYEFLLKNFDKENLIYKTISHNNDKTYGLPFGKIHDPRTLMDEHKYESDNFGVYIDIFPIDGIICNAQTWICWLLRRILNCKRFVKGKGRNASKDFMMSIAKFFLFPIKTNALLISMNKISSLKNYDDSKTVGSFCSGPKKRAKYSKTVFESWILMEFEGKKYRLPIDYDTYLKKEYGNYLQLPPIEKQVSHHDSVARWK